MPETFWVGLVGSVVFGTVGIILLILGVFGFDKVCKKIDFQEKINESPIACGIVIAAFMLAVAYIVGQVVH